MSRGVPVLSGSGWRLIFLSGSDDRRVFFAHGVAQRLSGQRQLDALSEGVLDVEVVGQTGVGEVERLERASSIFVFGNPKLESLRGLDSLREVDSLWVTGNLMSNLEVDQLEHAEI